MSKTGVKRIIFSHYSEINEEHTSSSEYKRSQFKKFKDRLAKKHAEYALLCGADYHLFNHAVSKYDDLQFWKIKQFEAYSINYDEVLYLDLDVVPQTSVNFFEKFNLDSICAFSMNRSPANMEEIKWKIKDGGFDRMNVFAKGCCKRSMLLIDDINSNDDIINTGVLGGNRKSISELSWSKRLSETVERFNDAVEDNLYPQEIVDVWRPNNEVFITYMIEKYEVPFHNIGMAWNFMLDDYAPEGGDASHFLHHIRKEFEKSFE